MNPWRKFLRWLAHHEFERARGEGRAFAQSMTVRQQQQEFAEGTLHGIKLMQDEIDRVVNERTGGQAETPTVEDLRRARGGLIH